MERPWAARTQSIKRWIGVELDEVTHAEKLISAVGGGLSIVAIFIISRDALGMDGAAMTVASMGASAVLLFAVPHGQLSQPWPIFAGHISAALIGVGCARLIGNTEVAAACAVALAIGFMHQCKCIHPPGGATALTAVIGGSGVRSLGWSYVWSPIVLNCLVIVAVAIAFNALFGWRRYPAHLARRSMQPWAPTSVEHHAVIEALRQVDSFIDVTEADLVRIHRLMIDDERRQRGSTG